MRELFPQTRGFKEKPANCQCGREAGTNSSPGLNRTSPAGTSSSGFTLQIVRDTLLLYEPPSFGQMQGHSPIAWAVDLQQWDVGAAGTVF